MSLINIKDVILTTGDLHKNYEIIGVVSVHDHSILTREKAMLDATQKLSDEIKTIKADAIVFFKIESTLYNGKTWCVMLYGTAVKFV